MHSGYRDGLLCRFDTTGALTWATYTSPPKKDGRLTRNFGGAGTLLDQAEKIHYPALGLFGGADQGIPVSDVHTFEEKLKNAGVEHEIIIYPDAPHSFFDRRATDYAEASTDSWKRILDFVSAHPVTR